MTTHYKTLGLPTTASISEVKKAYRFLASKYHPDKHDGDQFFADKFKEVKEAYDAIVKENLNKYAQHVAVDMEEKRKAHPIVHTYQNPYQQTSKTTYRYAQTEAIPVVKSWWITPIQNKGCLVVIYGFWILFALLVLLTILK